jgi:hypothetical protein
VRDLPAGSRRFRREMSLHRVGKLRTLEQGAAKPGYITPMQQLRSEIACYMVEKTKEQADPLGISLIEKMGKREEVPDMPSSLDV